MRLATLDDGSPDGRLVVVSPDGKACAAAPVKTLQEAVERWDQVAPQLAGATNFPDALDETKLRSPLPPRATFGVIEQKVVRV